MSAATPTMIATSLMAVVRGAQQSAEEALVGRLVRVMSDHNGQPFGRSRKSWRGEMARIKHVHIDVHNGISLGLEGHEYGECFIPADEVEFV